MKTIKCGFSQCVITPKGDGIFLDGYGHRMSPSSNAHDDLYAKVAVFGDESDRFAIIAMDILGMNAEVYRLFTDYIETLTGLDKEHTAICGIHSHSGPASGMLEGLPINFDYWCHTAELCAKAIQEATDQMCECTCSSAIADKELTSSVNRRDRPYNDRRIRAAVFKDMNGNLRGVIANANCHPVINTSLEMSADYPQVLTRRTLETYQVPFIFLLGRSADINPHPDLMNNPKEGLEILGNELTDAVFDAVNKSSDGWSADFIKHAYKIGHISMKPFEPLDKMENSYREQMNKYVSLPWSLEKHYELRELEWRRHMLNMAKEGKSPDMNVPFQVFSIGKRMIFVFISFETLTITGNKLEEYLIEQGYEPENIFIVSCANSVNSYLAPFEEFPYGGYEVSGASHWYGLPECSEQTEADVITHFHELIQKIQA